MTSANKNAFDWHCEDHDTYGWRGDECRMCPEAPSEASRLRSEVKILQEQNAALLVAIEAKDAALEKIACVGNGDSHGNSIGNCMAIDALAISQSAELLDARDCQRDAKLLRAAEEASDDDGYPVDIWKLADARESGEWKPEL